MAMQTLEKALAELVMTKQITLEEALSKTGKAEELKRLVSQLS
jgi:twitching motility protein PilT